MSAPSSSGRCMYGVAKVLSTAVRMLCFLPISETLAMSTRYSRGLVGVSIQNKRVFFLMALSKLTGSRPSM